MRVFISSTIYDLVDVRDELSNALKLLGISPILSDDKTSDFEVLGKHNSIQTCLVNLERSDAVIFVLDKRYGPSLAKAGFDDISATHLEYRHAIKCGKKVLFYVRDRLEADYSTWKRNGRKEIKSCWADGGDERLFHFIDEHVKLNRKSKNSNWYSIFTSSIDLKSSVDIQLGKSATQKQLTQAIYENKFPLFDANLEAEHTTIDNCPTLIATVTLINASNAAAFSVETNWVHRAEKTITPTDFTGIKSIRSAPKISSPGKKYTLQLLYGLGTSHNNFDSTLTLEYESPIGIAVKDEYHINLGIRPGTQPLITTSCQLTDRSFRRIDVSEIKIIDE